MLGYKYTPLRVLVIALISTFASLCPSSAKAQEIPADSATAVIFAYQRVGEDATQQSNITTEQFDTHIKELVQGGYTVMPLQQIIDTVKNGGTLPPRAVALTFDGAYQTTMANIIPRLTKAGLPFTVFFSSGMADSGAGHLNWVELKKLKRDKLVSLGILPSSYVYLLDQTDAESAALINRAVAQYRDILGEEPQFFAYPYGEYGTDLKKQLAGYKFKGAFGQHSGVIHAGSDFLALPRFTMTGEYGDLDRFILTARALPLPISDMVPDDTVLTRNPPNIGFTVTPDIKNLSGLACFASNVGKLNLARLDGNRIELRPSQPFIDRRTRINCTLPAEETPGQARRWRWFGMMFMQPDHADDETPAENAVTTGNQ